MTKKKLNKQQEPLPESQFLRHEPCPGCSSSDNLARYSDGHAHCFGCGYREKGDGEIGEAPTTFKKNADLLEGDYQALGKRGITEETCRKFHYLVGKDKAGTTVQIANYYDGTRLVAQKVRYPNKDFTILGDMKLAGLYGQQLWPKGNKLVITEGEIDALSVSQMQSNKWPVVSLPNGAQGAKKAISRQLEYLSNFEQVIFMFDMDEPGQKAAQECAELLPPGKAFVAHLPAKDANELLQAGRGDEIVRAIWNAKPFRPDGVVRLADIRNDILAAPEEGLPWFTPTLTKLTFGRRYGEVYTFGAGTGIGKTDFLTHQIQYDVQVLQQKVGLFFLEQKPSETTKRIVGKAVGKCFHIPDGTWTQAELVEALDNLEKTDLISLYDSFGNADWDAVSRTIRFMAHNEGTKIFYIDHLTALADQGDGERESLERIMKDIAMLANELKVIICLVSHLSTPEGKSHEEGGRVMIKHFKGSRAIGFWSHYMFGLERDPQDEKNNLTTTFRILKDRYTGRSTGKLIYFGYDVVTGKLFETVAPGESPFPDDKTEEF